MRKKTTIADILHKRADELRSLGRSQTAEHYDSTARKIINMDSDAPLSDIRVGVICDLSEKLLASGLDKNTVAFYLRTARAAYNYAVNHELVKDTKPFAKVNCATKKTRKRALTEPQLKAVATLDISDKHLLFARDLFLLSYMLRGMPPIDLFNLRWSDINNGVLSYKRSKTKQAIVIQVCKPIEDLLNKIGNKNSDLIFSVSCRIKSRQRQISEWLHKVGDMAKIPFPLTMYVARHTWASMAQTKNVPLAVISKGLGHDNLLTTQVYLSGIENCVVDRYNRNLIAIITK